MRIDGAFVESEVSGCCGNAGRSWSGGINICMIWAGCARVHLRGRDNILKRLVVHSGAANLGLLMRKLFGKGTPRGLAGALPALISVRKASTLPLFAPAMLVRKLSDSMAWAKSAHMISAAA
jgi:hypothetical protein